MKKILIALLIGYIFYYCPIQAQSYIQGKYDSKNHLFITNDSTYWIDFFQGDVARISSKGLFGLMDKKGKILCPPKYDLIYDFYKSVAVFSLNDKLGLININSSEIIPHTYKEIIPVNDSLYIVVNEEDKYGVLNNKGTLLTPIKFEKLIRRDENILFYDGEHIGIIDLKTGTELIVFKHNEEIFRLLNVNVFHIHYNNRSVPLLAFSDNLSITFKKVNDKYLFGFMDRKFKTIIEPIYDWVEPFKEGYALVKKEGKWGIIDTSGQLIIPIKYDNISFNKKYNFFYVTQHKQRGLLNISNEVIVPILYNTIKIINNKTFIVSKNNVFGVVDDKHNILIPIAYKDLFYISKDLFAVSHDGEKWGVIDKNGKVILKEEYYAIDGSITNGNLAIKIDDIDKIDDAEEYRYSDTVKLIGYFFNKKGLLNQQPQTLIHLKSSREYIPYYHYPHYNPSDFYQFIIEPYSIYPKPPRNKTKQKRNKKTNYPFQIKSIIDKPWVEHRAYGSTIEYSYLQGIKNANNEFVIPLIYREIESTRLYDEKNKYLYPKDFIQQDLNIFIIKKNCKYGVIDINHKMILNLEYGYIEIIKGKIIVYKYPEPYQNLQEIFFNGQCYNSDNKPQKTAIFDFTGKMIESFEKT